MTSKRFGVPSNSKALREAIFGPPPILKYESRKQYDLLLERLYADLKPTDIVQESWVHDLAYWIWEIRRWRRMRICLIEAEIPKAMLWVLSKPIGGRLSCIGEYEKVDAGDSVRPLSEEDSEKMSELFDELGMEEPDEDSSLPYNFDLVADTIRLRAFLEESDFVEHVDRKIIIAEDRRNAIFREIDRHRAGISFAWREKVRNIEQAEFRVVKAKKYPSKKANR